MGTKSMRKVRSHFTGSSNEVEVCGHPPTLVIGRREQSVDRRTPLRPASVQVLSAAPNNCTCQSASSLAIIIST